MRFESLRIKQGLFEREFSFQAGVNIVHSKTNSVGKTTLLRLLIYSLGYSIPSMRGLDFRDCELFAKIVNDSGKVCQLYRQQDYVTFTSDGIEAGYSMPNDIYELHKGIFGIDNRDVIDNLLGAFYVDQEKGWTLLNRGKAIGNNHFSIEGLILGLSDRSCDTLEKRLREIARELQKYRYMRDMSKYQREINDLGENSASDTRAEEIEKKLDVLRSDRRVVADELKRVESVIRKNHGFEKYISSMKLRVRAKDGTEIPVNESTIVGYGDIREYLVAKRQMSATQLSDIDRRIESLEGHLGAEATLFDVRTRIEKFDADISKLHIDARATERIIEGLEKEERELEDHKVQLIKRDNPIIFELHGLISSYAAELGIDKQYVRPAVDFIFTSDLKTLSGAIFHKIVFAFKMAYIKVIHEHTGSLLPIILDSPSGREVDRANIGEMMSILSREFSDHQIIIASINQYDFPDANIIELKDRLLSI
ncbi:MAG TPA: hypothetical protein VFB98_00280 [Candidatus Deferrimicrobium sp.]|nr:hypothetical protein [Candidatus Deferrimicrobium sp.]